MLPIRASGIMLAVFVLGVATGFLYFKKIAEVHSCAINPEAHGYPRWDILGDR